MGKGLDFLIYAKKKAPDYSEAFVDGRGGRNRTLVKSFGDSYSTVELRPYISRSLDDLYIISYLFGFVKRFSDIFQNLFQIPAKADTAHLHDAPPAHEMPTVRGFPPPARIPAAG